MSAFRVLFELSDKVTYVVMVAAMLECLGVPCLALAAVVCLAWYVARRHTHREIDREYERLCLETGRDIF